MPVRAEETSAPSQISGSNCGQTAPQACSLLGVGQPFSGTWNVSSLQKDEAWRVNFRIQGCDLEHGYLCGTMEALNVPMADTPVVTFWEGEIVDTKNYTFFTGKWEATTMEALNKKVNTWCAVYTPNFSQSTILQHSIRLKRG